MRVERFKLKSVLSLLALVELCGAHRAQHRIVFGRFAAAVGRLLHLVVTLIEVQGAVLVGHSASRTAMVVVDKIARVVDPMEEAVVTAASQLRQKHAPGPNIFNDRTLMLARTFASSSEPKRHLIRTIP